MTSTSLPLSSASGIPHLPIPRQQVSIERLPARRQSNEPRESMNCKSCRKRKIKCNRTRPSCEACQVFQSPCIYDATPKKRGPKTDVLEALLKRVDGLEAKLKEQNAEGPSSGLMEPAVGEGDGAGAAKADLAPKKLANESNESVQLAGPRSATPSENPASPVDTEALLHTYFTRSHGKPYYILDEPSVRQRMKSNQLPYFLRCSIWAVASRNTPHPNGPEAAVQLGHEFARQSRKSLDTDDPSIDCLQALLLLVTVFTASGHGKKAYMLMSSAIGMAMALGLHREIDVQSHVAGVDAELRRRLFWTCYLLDRFLACGSKRACLISDDAIALRLPSWCPSPSSSTVDGDFFAQGSNLQHYQEPGRASQGNMGLLVNITRVLGMTNRYLAAGGVKGDSHFPWHSLSTLSKIRHELDSWAAGARCFFSGLDGVLQQAETCPIFLGRMIYHLVHCLVYRPFLPVDLAELASNGQHQCWNIEATHVCFLHANAICELADMARHEANVEWPAIVGYCLSTAATVHIHGAHYTNTSAYGGDLNIVTTSSDFLTRGMQRLDELDLASAANVSQQSDALRRIYNAHGKLVQALGANPMQYSPGFHLEDFFDRYSVIGGLGGDSTLFDPVYPSAWPELASAGARFDDSSMAYRDAKVSEHGHKRQQTCLHETPPRAVSGLALGQEHAADGRPVDQTGQGAGGLSDESKAMQSGARVSQGPSRSYFSTPTDGRSTGSVSVAAPGMQAQAQAQARAQAQAQAQGLAYKVPPATEIENEELAVTAMGGTMMMMMSNIRPGFHYSPSSSYLGSNVQGQSNGGAGGSGGSSGSSYGPLLGSQTSSHGFGSSPVDWQADNGDDDDDDGGSQGYDGVRVSWKGTAGSPGAKSADGRTGNAQGEEKDPFLSLLEHLVENEEQFDGAGMDLDFLMGGTNGGGM